MAEYTPERVLVTGGAGFIGANFVRHLLSARWGIRVVTLDLLTYAGSLENLADLPGADRHTFVKGDICDEPLVERLLRDHRIDTVIHFAAESHVDRSIEGPAPFMRTNVQGTFSLLEAARRAWLDEPRGAASARRFHHISTDEVYGALRLGAPAFSEDTPYAPSSPYAASKAASDHLVRAYQRTYGLPTLTTNGANTYGPRQHGEKFIPTVIGACQRGASIPVYGDGSNIRDWLHVADHCAGILAVLERGRVGERYNIGGDNERTNIDVARRVCRLFDELRPAGAPHERLITFVKDRPGHDFRYAIDPRKVREEIGWAPVEPFEAGLRKTIGWTIRD